MYYCTVWPAKDMLVGVGLPQANITLCYGFVQDFNFPSYIQLKQPTDIWSMNRIRGLADGFDLGMNMLFDGDKEDDGGSSKPYAKSGKRKTQQKSKKRKRH